MTVLSSVQVSMVDLQWIRQRVMCFGTTHQERYYRAALAVEGPPDAFDAEPERSEPVSSAFAGFLNALGHPIQILVLPRLATLDTYAAKLEARARTLPRALAAEALADARWARDEGPRLGLLDRRTYMVVPAEDAGSSRVAAPGWFARALGRHQQGREVSEEVDAGSRLDERCASLSDRLWRGGVWSERLDDPALLRLVQTCWSAWRHGQLGTSASRLAIDLESYMTAANERSS